MPIATKLAANPHLLASFIPPTRTQRSAPETKPSTPENTSATIATRCCTMANALCTTSTPSANIAWNTAKTELASETTTPMMPRKNCEMASRTPILLFLGEYGGVSLRFMNVRPCSLRRGAYMLGAELHYRTDVIVVVQTPRVLGGRSLLPSLQPKSVDSTTPHSDQTTSLVPTYTALETTSRKLQPSLRLALRSSISIAHSPLAISE